MEKGVVVFVLFVLLSNIVAAVSTGVPSPNDDVEGVTRITKFETDNVHILRIGNFSRAVVNEVLNLQENISVVQHQLADIKNDIEGLKKVIASNSGSDGVNQISAAVVGIEAELEQLKKLSSNKSSEWSSALVLNVIILVGIFALFLFIRVNSPFDSKKQAEIHAKLHLNNAVRNALKSGIAVENVRHRFVAQGWHASWVDSAIEDGVKR